MHLIGKINGADCDAGSFDDGVAAAGLDCALCEPHKLRRHEHNVKNGLADLRVEVTEVLAELGDVLSETLVGVALRGCDLKARFKERIRCES